MNLRPAAAEQAALLAGVVEHNVALIYVKDLEGRYLLYNQPFADAFALDDRGDAAGKSGREVLLGHDDMWLDPVLAPVWREHDLRAREGPYSVEEFSEHPTRGRVYYDSIKFPIVGPDGAVRATCGVSIDITERRRVEVEHLAAEARFRGVFEGAPTGMALLTLDGRFDKVNDALCRITGYERDQLELLTLEQVTHSADRARCAELVRRMIAGEDADLALETRHIHAAGEAIWVSVAARVIRDPDGEAVHLLAQIQDISERRAFEHQLQHMALHDQLTGLLNRRALEQHLDRAAANARRCGPEGALLMLDVDNFKFVNDTLGHSAGDELILSLAGLLRARLRDTDIVARLGGDEFVILLPKARAEEAEHVAGTLLCAIREHTIRLAGVASRQVTASLGVALFDGSHASGEEVLVNADLAMYDAKEAGRDRVARFSASGHGQPKVKARMAWLARMQHALASDEFELFAQPIVELQSGEVHRHELLLRMRGYDNDLVAPADFLHIAERFDMIQAIDRWVIAEAVRLAAEHPGTKLAVNVSAKSIADPRLLEYLRDELARHQSDASALCFEMTETEAVANVPLARHFAEQTAALGASFALDDFGAGFGSFYYLKHLPFDYVKIDGEFISNCVENRTDQLVVQAVVDIARGLGKQTTAECVGDERTVRFLRRYGVDHGQGYHIGRPIPVLEALGGRTPITSASARESSG